MISNFRVFERLGYSEEVSMLAEYCWKLYKSGKRIIELDEYSKNNLSIYINKLIINDYKDMNDDTIMYIGFNNVYYRKTKNVKIYINRRYKPNIISFEHEIKHLYDFIKSGGDFLKIKDKKLYSPFISMVDEDKDKNMTNFLYIVYISQMSEIVAHYHGDIRNFKQNSKKFDNSVEKFIKYSRLKKDLDFIKENPIQDIISKISYGDKISLIRLYYEIKNTENYFNLTGIKLKFATIRDNIKNIFKQEKQYSKKEIDDFLKKIEKDVEKKKKIFQKYIGRLYAYFN